MLKQLCSFVIAAAFVLPASAMAQISPTDTGAGELRGIQDLNNSGQIGTATFYSDGPGTRVVVKVRGMRPGRIEPLAILRGKHCDAIEPAIGWTLPPLINGESTAILPAPMAKILSGNYVIVAHADDHVPGHNLACGPLFH